MNPYAEIIFYLEQLKATLEEDRRNIIYSLGGELCEAYQELLTDEITELSEKIRLLHNYSYL